MTFWSLGAQLWSYRDLHDSFLCYFFFFSFDWNYRMTLLIEKFKIIFMWYGQIGVLFFWEWKAAVSLETQVKMPPNEPAPPVTHIAAAAAPRLHVLVPGPFLSSLQATSQCGSLIAQGRLPPLLTTGSEPVEMQSSSWQHITVLHLLMGLFDYFWWLILWLMSISV